MDIILVIGLVVNTIMAIIFPAQIFEGAPLDMAGQTVSGQEAYFNGSTIWQYDDEAGLQKSNTLEETLKNSVDSTDNNAGIFSETFGFIDWVKDGFALIKNMLMFLVGFIILLWNLVFPLNFLVGIPFSFLYLYSIASFIIGRS